MLKIQLISNSNQQSGNVYGIQCVDDGVMLDVSGGKMQNGQHVIMHHFNNQNNQRWCTEVASNVIRCKANQQLALDSDKGRVASAMP